MSVVDEAAADLLDRGASLLVVTCEADFASPAIARAEEAGVLVVSPCGSEQAWGTGELGPLAFSMSPSAQALGSSMADFAWGQGYRNVAVLFDETAPGPRAECQGFRARFEQLGGRVRDEYAMNPVTAESLALDPARLERLDRDALVLCSFWRVGQLVLASVRGQGSRVPILAGPSLDSGVWVPEDVGAPLRDFTMLTFASTAGDDPSDAVIEAAGDYLIADGVPPSSGSFVLGADLAEAYRLAVERAGTFDGRAIADALRAMSDAPLVSGPVSFGGGQAPTQWELRIMRNEDGVLANDGTVPVTPQ
jgi:branched-chain amino acid transport system substrate-binding protein